ncbi:developmental regulatory protein WetA [Aspergillus candidus]|uniref:Developmental regulatory protein wetA n=1 Tax=Aspergillus candidus TaxID=41067 RepID=A0A2I2FHI1_ASPCN|nr:hypothetical protein BDW47DRAFT_130499 [Aspergillus candidus]PLB40086.1 hypothetical protein BDW47DRAFT_130499 [Aspergillus candidus]
MFAHPYDHSFNDLFNQYVNMDTSSTDGNKDISFSGDLDQMFSLDPLPSDCGEHSPSVSTSKQPQQSPQQQQQAWGKDVWSLPPDTAPSAGPGPLAFQDSIQPSAVSDLNDNLDIPSADHHPPAADTGRSSPSTPPQTPNRKNKSALLTPKSIRRHREPNGRGHLRKQSFSPGLTRTSQLQKGRMAYPDAWTQRLQQNFNFRSADDRLPLSPPPSDILVQQENMAPADSSAMNPAGDSAEMPHHYDSGLFHPSPAISMPSPSANTLARPPPRYLSQSHNSTLTSSPPPADDIFSSPHSSDPQSLSSWHSDSLGSSTFPFTPDLGSHDAQAWWASPMAGQVAPRQPSYQPIIASPTPQRPMQNNQHDMLQGGLMIQLDPSSFDMSTASSSFPPSTMPTAPTTQDTHAYHTPAPPSQSFVDSSSFTTPNGQHPSRSPSMSPGTGGSPGMGSTMSSSIAMKTPQRRPHGRKLSGQSMSAPRPVKGSSPKNSNKSVTVSFVNFTPSDSRKILGGVAPSGSSKTKARREQEARDRRRKLSEAALQAVRKAGGDVDTLEAILY